MQDSPFYHAKQWIYSFITKQSSLQKTEEAYGDRLGHWMQRRG